MVGNPDQGCADSGEVVSLCIVGARRELPLLFVMEVIVEAPSPGALRLDHLHNWHYAEPEGLE
jgi:hypothetical protein